MGRVSDAKERLMEAVLELIWSGSYGSTTIDHICERAGVKKGSFYYFFDSKSELAVEAFEACWQNKRAEMDSIFSPAVPPLERLQKYYDFAAGLAGLRNLHAGGQFAEENPGDHGSKVHVPGIGDPGCSRGGGDLGAGCGDQGPDVNGVLRRTFDPSPYTK